MQNDIPHITFNSQKPDNSGIEIVTIESLALRKKEADHDSEKRIKWLLI